jgi:hypothetical protein
MKSQAMNTILGIAGALTVFAVIVVAILWTTLREDRLTTIRSTPKPLAVGIPPIDAAAPSEVGTATFALG